MWDYLLLFVFSTTTILFHIKCYVHGSRSCIERKLKKFENIKVWNNCLACHRGCAWFEYFVWWRWSIAGLYDFVGITFFSHAILRRHDCFISMLEVLLFLMSIWTFILNHLDLNIHATIKKITLRIMLGSIPHQKFCFYHLPTRGRAGMKLRDAWYVSNISIFFDCSMLLYYLFWMLMGFILWFYIIFGTNLLTQGPVQIAVWYVSVVSTFPNTFALVLDSNLHDLNGTNPDWRYF